MQRVNKQNSFLTLQHVSIMCRDNITLIIKFDKYEFSNFGVVLYLLIMYFSTNYNLSKVFLHDYVCISSVGYLYDSTQSYDSSFYMGGSLIIVSTVAFCLLELPVFRKQAEKNQTETPTAK